MVHTSAWKLVLYKGCPVCSVWFGLWGHFGIQKQVGEDQVGSLFFPAVFRNIVLDQKNWELQKQHLTIPSTRDAERACGEVNQSWLVTVSSVCLECGLKLRSHATHPRHPARRPLPHCFNKSGLQDSDTSFVLWFSLQFLLHTPIHLIPIHSSQIEAEKVTIIKQKFSPASMFSLVTVDVIWTLKCQEMT